MAACATLPSTTATLVSGVAFGAALTASGAHDPRIIIAQLQLRDFRMSEIFLTGSGLSGLAIYLTHTFRKQSLKPKAAISLGSLKYAGNILGGSFIGMGMAMSGACPGTALVQAIQGVPTGYYALLGAFLGGGIYAIVKKIPSLGLDRPFRSSPSIASSTGIRPTTALLAYELICALITFTSTNFGPHALQLDAVWPITSITGGLVIGAAQMLSLVLRNSSVGVSTVFEDVGDSFLRLVTGRSKSHQTSRTSGSPTVDKHVCITPAIYFACGLASGSFLLTLYRPAFAVPLTTPFGVSASKAVIAGVLMSFGARLASGCTSGHGLSGTAQLAMSSFLTTAAMFGAGITVASTL